ncbi:hypothetical protein G7Y89_g7356 [Cudoniella acicularis]|uniref:Fork-head domain-containing protein n=1 Tax=Cudoniella acicularis TaxID=354080 RepID=A0A8H4RKN2_9HELO|nr:hypothetical protein G7Y89_g7356 [Cudoniella acicularis]
MKVAMSSTPTEPQAPHLSDEGSFYAGERAVGIFDATAMTSPNDPLAPPVAMTDHDNPPESDFTAVESAEDGHIQPDEIEVGATATAPQPTTPAENNTNQNVAEIAGKEQSKRTTPDGLPAPTAPDAPNAATPEGAGPNETTEEVAQPAAQPAIPLPFPMGAMGELEHMDMQTNNGAWSAAMNLNYYGQPMDGLSFASNPGEGLLALQMAMDGSAQLQNALGLDAPLEEPRNRYNGETDRMDKRSISAYAKLEFEDGEFYMNTYGIILGRDLRAAKAAARWEKLRQEAEAAGADPRTPVQFKKEASRYTKSIVSESGGILREGNDSDDEEPRPRKKRKQSRASKKSKSTGSSQELSRRNSIAKPNGFVTYEAQLPARRTAPDDAAPVDPDELKPSPFDCPIVPIHPGAATPASMYKSISRQHVKIAYNNKKNVFEAIIIGRNGAFVDEVFCHHEAVIPLKSGSRLQIGGVVVRFVLPDVPMGQTGAEERHEYDESVIHDRYSEGGKEMSFDFEDEPRGGAMEDTSEDQSVRDASSEDEENPDFGREEQSDGNEEDEEESDLDDQLMQPERAVQTKQEQGDDPAVVPEEAPVPQKKRGPGRPPKNGIMSKREQQLAKKAALAREKEAKEGEIAAAKPPVAAQPAVPGKNKVGRPRKHPRPDTPPEPREKRKYTKRKPKEPKVEDGEVKQEGDGEDPPKTKKEKKPLKPPRSPSPELKESDFTEEQLKKPPYNYVQLIHEAITNSGYGQMSLPQIYKAITTKYPYFRFKTGTFGWQSSVRHNLSQNQAFQKVERDGKGWMWAVVEGISIEKEKKKKTSPPPMPQGGMHHQPIYPGHPPHMMGPPPPYTPGMMGPPQGYPQNPHLPPHLQPGQAPYMGPPHHMHPQHPHQAPNPPMIGQLPTGFAVPAIPPQLAPSNGPTSYSSPYAPKPAPTNPPQNEQRPPETKPPPQPAQPAQPTQSAPPVPQQAPPKHLPQHSARVLEAVETFKSALLKSMNSENSRLIMDSAVKRVLGYSNQSSVSNDPEHREDMIMDALLRMLKNIPDLHFESNANPTAEKPQKQTSDQGPSPPTNDNRMQVDTGPTPVRTTDPPKPGPAVTRPMFTGQDQNRSGGSSVPRPPMITPGMKRANSGSPANTSSRPTAPSSASPAPPHTPSSPNGANTPQHPTNEVGQVASQKRERTPDDADDMRESKRVALSGPTQLKT